MDEDLALHPEWEQYTPKWEGLFHLEQDSESPVDCNEVGSACPFAHLMQFLQ